MTSPSQTAPATDEEIQQLASTYDEPDTHMHDFHIQVLIARIKFEREQTIRECQAVFKKMPDGTKIDDAFEALLQTNGEDK